MNMKRTIKLLGGAMAAVLVLSACGGGSSAPDEDVAANGSESELESAPPTDDTSSPSEDEEETTGPGGVECPEDVDRIAYSPLTMEFDYFRFTVEGLEEVADQCGVEVLIDDPGNDAAAQVSGLENMITAGADAVIIVSVDPQAIQTAVSAADREGIPVISQVSTFEGAVTDVGLNETEFGRLSSRAAAEALIERKPDESTYQVAILNADSLGAGLLDRKEGLTAGLDEVLSDYEIVADVEAFSEDTALSAVETILQANQDLDLILTVNDPGSLGARSAVEAAGLSLEDEVIVAGLGPDRRVLEGVLDGDFPVSVSSVPIETGRALGEITFRVLNGEQVESDIDIDPQLVTQDNAQDFIDQLYE